MLLISRALCNPFGTPLSFLIGNTIYKFILHLVSSKLQISSPSLISDNKRNLKKRIPYQVRGSHYPEWSQNIGAISCNFFPLAELRGGSKRIRNMARCYTQILMQDHQDNSIHTVKVYLVDKHHIDFTCTT